MSPLGPTAAKRRLSRRLAAIREDRGYTANQVCDRLGWGRGKVGRIEANTWKRIDMSAMRDLMRTYEVSEAVQAELAALADRARARPWWRDYQDVFGDSEYPGYEEDAIRIRVYLPLLVPALLATPAYMDSVFSQGVQPTGWRERAREAGARRREILDRTDGTAPEFVAIITEAALSYQWGKIEDRREQLNHLIAMGTRPGVEIRMLRFADGPHPGMSSLISIFDFPGNEPSVVFLENDIGLEEVIDQKRSAQYAEVFERTSEAALSAPATTAQLKNLIKSLE
jgi:transcriptional regulator with XRE-family HTH domain